MIFLDLETLKQFVQNNYHVGDIVLIPNPLADTKKEGKELHPAKLTRFYDHTVGLIDIMSSTGVSFRYYDLWSLGNKYLELSCSKLEDVPPFLENACNWAIHAGVMTKTTDTTFTPNQPCTRAEVIQAFYNAYGNHEDIFGKSPFADISENSSYAKAVKWAFVNGIVRLHSEDENFRPDELCTHKELVEFMWGIAGKPEIENYTLFSWAELNGFFEDIHKDIFQEEEPCTRAEVIQLLYNSFDETERLYYIPENRFRIGDVFRIPNRVIAKKRNQGTTEKQDELDGDSIGTLMGMYRRYMFFVNKDTNEKMRVDHKNINDITLIQQAPLATDDKDADLVRSIVSAN